MHSDHVRDTKNEDMHIWVIIFTVRYPGPSSAMLTISCPQVLASHFHSFQFQRSDPVH